MTNIEDLKKLKRMRVIEDYPDFAMDLNRHKKNQPKKNFKVLSDEQEDELLTLRSSDRQSGEDNIDPEFEEQLEEDFEQYTKVNQERKGLFSLMDKLNMK